VAASQPAANAGNGKQAKSCEQATDAANGRTDPAPALRKWRQQSQWCATVQLARKTGYAFHSWSNYS
jgi:hypothetical protein